ncbi:MAG: prepilin peptidase [Kurthia sp.]|nr:prepilin peptidase [Candidatus Kurthia equi]
MLYLCLCVFILGASLGSFYHVVGQRLPLGKSVITPRSQCDSCQHQLTIGELIPIASYFFLKGRCRKCGEKYGSLHILLEFLTGLLFVLAFLTCTSVLELTVAWTMISLLVIITVSDLLYTLILDKILLIFGSVIFLLRMVAPLDPLWDMFAGAFLGCAILLFLTVVSKGGIGGGDIKLYLIIGFILGSKLTLLSLLLSAIIGLLVALFLKKGVGQSMPFGPSIAGGSLLSYFYGEDLLNFYFSLLIY